jgi:aldehyde dehydrogenase (NAD+)
VVFKPSEEAPHSATVLCEIMSDAGVPDGVVNLIHGAGEAGKALVEHPDVDAIGFTGSSETGKAIGATCGRLNKKYSAEMGGKNPMIVMEDADLDLALEGVIWGAYGTTGQRCTATSRLIIHEDVEETFIEMIQQEARDLTLGSGLDEGTDVGPVINEDALEKIGRYIQEGTDAGAELLFGGERATDGALADGCFFQPTLFRGVERDMSIFQEEIFGPVLSVHTISSYEEAAEAANDTVYGLSSSIYTNNVARAFRAMHDLEAGITYVNGPTIGAEAHMPFGGVKDTGNGHRDGGWEVFEFYTETKTVYVDYSGQLQKAQIDNVED